MSASRYPEDPPQAGHILALDGVRGLAVLFVLASHLTMFSMPVLGRLDLRGSGKYGVFLFFALSSFLLTLPFLTKRPRELADPYLWMNYFTRRILRIYPLYVVVLLVSLATSYATPLTRGTGLPFTLSAAEAVDHILLREGKQVLWSIPVEFKYYLVLPFVAAMFVLLLRARLIWCVVATMAMVLLARSLWPAVESSDNDVRLGPYLPIFLMGSVTALAHNRVQSSVARHTRTRLAALACDALALGSLAIVVLAIPVIYGAISGTQVRRTHFDREFTAFGLLWSAFIFGTLNGSGWLARWMSRAPLRFLGKISFSIYLWHFGIIVVISHLPLPALLQTVLAVTTILGVSWISYTLIERPLAAIRVRGPLRAPPVTRDAEACEKAAS